MHNDTCVAQVLEAARDLVAAFARTDTEAYFAAFSEDASFIFHTWPQPLLSRAAYREVWEGWLRDDGFEVLECQSSQPFVSLQGPDVAIFTHDVTTRLRVQGEESLNHERETIVFHRDPQGRWLAVHEHLSATP